jgi:hypothetical protein
MTPSLKPWLRSLSHEYEQKQAKRTHPDDPERLVGTPPHRTNQRKITIA